MNEEQLEHYSNLFNKVKEHMNWDDCKTDLWFQLQNPLLGNMRPIEMYYINREFKLQKLVDSLIEENYKE